MTSSAPFIYERILHKLAEYFPTATLEYSEKFWEDFEPYPFDNELNIQCLVGIISKINHEAVSCVFKVSRVENNLTLHEYSVIRHLAERLGPNFPHICRTYGLVKYKSEINILDGPTENSARFVYRDMLLIENIPSIGAFVDVIHNKPFNIVISLFKQVLMTIRCFRTVRATHFDLHPDNILVKKCSEDIVLEYNNGVCIPTFGYIAVIIDFGFAYTNYEHDGPLYADIKSASHGHLSDRYLPFSDYIRFFFTLSYDLRKETKPKIQKLRKRMLRLFHKYSPFVEKTNGWEKSRYPDHIEEIDIFLAQCGVSQRIDIFEEAEWVDIIQLLMPRPWRRSQSTKLNPTAFQNFATEWEKIQERVTKKELLLYLFHYLVKAIRQSAGDIPVTKSLFLAEFSRLVNSFLPQIDYSILVQAINEMAENLRDYLCFTLDRRETELLKFYQKLPFTDATCDDYIWEIFDNEFPLTFDTQRARLFKVQ